MMRLCLAILLCLVCAPAAFAEDHMDVEIDYLLETVANSNCVFVRNGDEHGPQAAKDHLSLKRRRGKRYFSSAEEFIDRLASKSSWSGKPYYIRCEDEEQQLASSWFYDVLAEYRSAQ